MAPLSVLPGRVRFELSGLVGKRDACAVCEANLRCLKGVEEVSANFRTGRLLVRYDEKSISSAELDACIRKAMKQAEDTPERKLPAAGRVGADNDLFPAGRFVMEMVVHAILPAPLDIIFPAAFGLLRRQPLGA
jgi:cation transport ATPase